MYTTVYQTGFQPTFTETTLRWSISITIDILFTEWPKTKLKKKTKPKMKKNNIWLIPLRWQLDLNCLPTANDFISSIFRSLYRKSYCVSIYIVKCLIVFLLLEFVWYVYVCICYRSGYFVCHCLFSVAISQDTFNTHAFVSDAQEKNTTRWIFIEWMKSEW